VNPVTLITNPSHPEDHMPRATSTTRRLERDPRATKKSATTKEAVLVLANGAGDNESTRIGLTLVTAGVSGVAIGVMEGLARRGKVKWYAELTPAKKATLLMAIFVAAGLVARWRRKQGDFKGACAAETLAISAFTVAAVVVAESAAAGDKGDLQGLGLLDGGADAALANLSPAQLDKLDAMLDDDIRKAAADLRRMHERGALSLPDANDDVAGLNAYGDDAYGDDAEFDDDDDTF